VGGAQHISLIKAMHSKRVSSGRNPPRRPRTTGGTRPPLLKRFEIFQRDWNLEVTAGVVDVVSEIGILK